MEAAGLEQLYELVITAPDNCHFSSPVAAEISGVTWDDGAPGDGSFHAAQNQAGSDASIGGMA